MSDVAFNQDEIDALLAEAGALIDDVGDSAPTPRSEPPAVSAAPIMPGPRPGRSPALAATEHEDPSRILNLEVPVIVQLAERTMPMADIMNLTTGAIIEFEKSADDDLDLMINNKCIGRGNAVKVGENFGLRINTIGSVRSRIKAMGGKSA
jgi:flagellar motor switch protein FliN/FliY